MVFQCINIRQAPWEVLKTAAFSLGFQYLPRDLVNVNAWNTMFDAYIVEWISRGYDDCGFVESSKIVYVAYTCRHSFPCPVHMVKGRIPYHATNL